MAVLFFKVTDWVTNLKFKLTSSKRFSSEFQLQFEVLNRIYNPHTPKTN